MGDRASKSVTDLEEGTVVGSLGKLTNLSPWWDQHRKKSRPLWQGAKEDPGDDKAVEEHGVKHVVTVIGCPILPSPFC